MDTFISTCQELDSSCLHPLLLWVFYLIKSSSAQLTKAILNWSHIPLGTASWFCIQVPLHSCSLKMDCFSHTLASSNLPFLSCLQFFTLPGALCSLAWLENPYSFLRTWFKCHLFSMGFICPSSRLTTHVPPIANIVIVHMSYFFHNELFLFNS